MAPWFENRASCDGGFTSTRAENYRRGTYLIYPECDRHAQQHGRSRRTTWRRRFQLVLIKPLHYDDDGYVIRWFRAFIPSNSLAVVSARRAAFGPTLTSILL